MSDNIGHDGPLTDSEIDQVFGDGEKVINRPMKYYAPGVVVRPNSVAHEFSNDSKLYRKGWWFVLHAAVVELTLKPVILNYANFMGWITRDQIFEVIRYAVIGAALIPMLYLLKRWLWVFVFRFGARFADRRIAAATALSIAVSVYINLILLPLQLVMLSAGLPSWIPGDNIYDQVITIAIILNLFLLIIIPGFYYRNVLEIGLLRAIAWNFLSYVLSFGILLLPIVAYLIST